MKERMTSIDCSAVTLSVGLWWETTWCYVTVPKLHSYPPFQWPGCLSPLTHCCTWAQTASDLSFPLSLVTAKVCPEWGSSLVREQKPWYFFFSLKNTIRTKAMINTHNWNKWQLTTENCLPAVGGRKLLTAGPHWMATKREELVGAEENNITISHHSRAVVWARDNPERSGLYGELYHKVVVSSAFRAGA